ncbi:MAG TPA: YdcF family protein [Prolixibacteraceae bacterium]|nr:YdcF family protein [Prolixibacteraceae bacterium]
MAKQNIIRRIGKVFRTMFIGFGMLFLVLLILSFTSLPYWGYYWLGTSQSEITEKPDYIVLLGGGGMPSESGLMRVFFVHRAAVESPKSRIIISIPGNPADSASTARMVAAELIQKGIDPQRILYEELATNTRSEALHLQRFNAENLTAKPVLLVTSPEHMRRAVLVFKKAGFTRLNALPTFENAIEANLFFDDDKLGGNKMPIPDIGNHTSVRYQFWNHLKYEILIAREMVALGYYKLRGWI